MSQVALIQCDSYDTEAVYKALMQGVAALGGIERFVRPAEKFY